MVHRTRRATPFRVAAAGGLSLALLAVAAPTAAQETSPIVDACAALPDTEIAFWRHYTPSGEQLIDQLLGEFQAAYPNLSVKTDLPPDSDYLGKLNTALASGAGPDAFQVYAHELDRYHRAGLLAPVDLEVFGYATTEEMLSEHFLPGTMDFAVKDGQLFAGGMPEFGTWAIAYNLDAFDAAGEPYLAEDQAITWDEYFALADRLTIRDGERLTQMGEGMWLTAQDNPTGAFIVMDPLFKQLGGNAFDEATGEPTNKDTWLAVARLIEASTLGGEHGYLDMAFPTDNLAQPQMFTGRIAMVLAGIWAEGWGLSVNPDLRIAFAPLPAVSPDHDEAGSLSWAFGVNARTSPEKQQAAWCLIEFLSNDTNAFTYYEIAGEVQPRNIEGFTDFLIERTPGMRTFLADASRAAAPAFGDRGNEYWDVLRKMVEAITKSGVSAEDAVDAAWAEMDALQ